MPLSQQPKEGVLANTSTMSKFPLAPSTTPPTRVKGGSGFVVPLQCLHSLDIGIVTVCGEKVTVTERK